MVLFSLLTLTSPFRGGLWQSHLYWYDGFIPVCSQVGVRNGAVVLRYVGQENQRERPESIGHDAGAEQEEDDLLEASPLTQESYGVSITRHSQNFFFGLLFCPQSSYNCDLHSHT